jgi:hypothetical protein
MAEGRKLKSACHSPVLLLSGWMRGYERDVRGFAHKLCFHVRDRCFISKGLFDAPPAAGQSEKWRLAS